MGKPEELYDMVHTENLVLVDTKREFVFYDGTKKRILYDLLKISIFK
jgi:protein SCO1/2